MIEKNINSILEALKNYLTNHSKVELVVLIKEYAKLGLNEDVSKYIKEFFETDGDIIDLIEISESFPVEIKAFLNGIKDKLEIEEGFDADSFLEMGELLWEIGSPNEARDNYLKAFKNYNVLGKKEQAEEVFNTLLSRYPDDDEIKHLEIKDVKAELLIKLDELKSILPKDEVDIRYALGKNLHEADLLSNAEENYKRILDIKSDHKARRYLVALLNDRDELDEALEYADKLEENDRLDVHYSLAKSFKNKGNIDKANTLLKEIYEINKDYKDVKELLETLKKEKEEEAFVDKDKEILKPVSESGVDRIDKGEMRIVFL